MPWFNATTTAVMILPLLVQNCSLSTLFVRCFIQESLVFPVVSRLADILLYGYRFVL
jgi:hypothetical protein